MLIASWVQKKHNGLVSCSCSFSFPMFYPFKINTCIKAVLDFSFSVFHMMLLGVVQRIVLGPQLLPIKGPERKLILDLK
jgi:hypothetical protein